ARRAVGSPHSSKHMDLLRSPQASQAEAIVPARAGRSAPLYLSNVGHGPGVQEDVPAQYWKQLWRIKWMVGGFAALGVGLGLALTAVQTPIYRARTTLELQSINQNYLDMKSIDPVGGNDSLETFLQTQIQLLASEGLLDRTGQKLKEVNPPTLTPPQPAE